MAAPRQNPADKLATQQSTIPAERPKTLADTINAMVPEFKRAMPSFLQRVGGPEALARIALTEMRKNTKLAECSKESFFGALMNCAQIGLMPGPLGHVYLIPFKGVVTLQIGYRGLIDLVRRSGDLSTIKAVCVYEGEHCEIDLGLSKVSHAYDYAIDRTNPAKILYVYAMATLKDGSTALEVMTRAEVDAIRKRSMAVASGRSTPWDTDYAEMAKKTVLKRLCKVLPLSADITNKLAADETVVTSLKFHDSPTSVYDIDPISIEVSTDPVQPEGVEETPVG